MVRHNPTDGSLADGQSWNTRSHLTACLSEDDGKTWLPHSLLLDERIGVSYPDGDQMPDGKIHIIYDYQRIHDREILMASFTEKDIIRAQAGSSTIRLRVLVNKATG